MVKIKCINENFINNNKIMNLTIPYDESKSSTTFIVDEQIIKKAKASCVIYGNCNVNGVTYFFKSLSIFLIVNNSTNIFLSNVSINQLHITDPNYNVIPDISEDDFIEHLLYDYIKQIFLSSSLKKQQDSSYLIKFNIPVKNSIDTHNIVFNELSTTFKIGVFDDNFF
jgi:hypothetical protein